MRQDPDTFEMIRTLSEADTFEQSLRELEKSVEDRTLPDLLMEYQARSALSTAEIADSALLSRSYTYQVFSGVRNPGRNAVLCIARVMGADLQETRKLLRLARKGDLYPRIRRDAAIIFAIQHDYDVMRLEALLLEVGEAALLRNS